MTNRLRLAAGAALLFSGCRSAGVSAGSDGRLTEGLAKQMIDNTSGAEQVEAPEAAVQCSEKSGWWSWAQEQDLFADPRIPKMVDVLVLTPAGQRLFAPSRAVGRSDKAGVGKEGGSVHLLSKRKALKLEFDGKPVPAAGLEGQVMVQVGEPRPEMRAVSLLVTWKWQDWPQEIVHCGFTSREEYTGDADAIEAYVSYQRQEWIRKNRKKDAVHAQANLPAPPKPPTVSKHGREKQSEFTFVKTAGRNWELQSCLACDDRH